jgi:hypothetical protein
MVSARTAVYVYCLVAAVRRPSNVRLPPGLSGGTRPALTVAGDGLFIVTSDVPLDLYGPRALERRLRNLDWVAETALAHETVVERLARVERVTIVPMKMFTMFSSIDKALEDIGARRQSIDAAVARVAGCQEWGLRITKAEDRGPRTEGRGAKGEERRAKGDGRGAKEKPGSGAAFLIARKALRDEARISRARSQAAAEAAFGDLERLARDVRRRNSEREPGSNPPVLEAAFLVASGARARFNAVARRHARACAADGAELVVTGPWPAYNFVTPAGDES